MRLSLFRTVRYILRADLLGLHYDMIFWSILEMIVSKFMFTMRSKFTIETCRLFSLALLGILLLYLSYDEAQYNYIPVVAWIF